MGCSSSSEPKPRPQPPPPVVDNNNDEEEKKQRSPRKYYTDSQNGDLYKESTDRGYKRRLRQNMIEATQGSDIEALEKAIKRFEDNRLEDCGDLTRAKDRLAFLHLRRDLRDAVNRSHVGVLERTLEKAYDSPHQDELQPQIRAAERRLKHLKELNDYNHDILAMDQQTISEIHSYHRPPDCVHDVMAASYMLLGHKESELRDWSYLQSMAGRVGRDSLINQVRMFDSRNVDERTSKRVREILNYHQLSEVRVASNGAAAFYVWSDNIVDKIEKDKQEEEERQRREEEERQREEEWELQQQQQQQNQRNAKGGKANKGIKHY